MIESDPSPQSISITSGSATLALLSPGSASFFRGLLPGSLLFLLLLASLPNCETVLQRSDKFIKFHLVHCRDDVLAVDGLPALVLRHRVGLRGRVENKYTGRLCDCDFGFIGDFTACWKTITDQLGDHGCGQ